MPSGDPVTPERRRTCRDCPTRVEGVMRQRCPACAAARNRRLRRVRYQMDRERELTLARRRYRRNRKSIRARQNANYTYRPRDPRLARLYYERRKAA